MHKLIVRLVACGFIAGGMGATALASGGEASIGVTGPGSTNIISSSNLNRFNSDLFNRVNTGNWNWQNARTGNLLVCGNTKVWGGGFGSGSAMNWNSGVNHVAIDNQGGWGGNSWNWGGGSGSGQASIFITGPDSFNRISGSNLNSFQSSIRNTVNANNFSTQTARSGGVLITGNTVVSGAGGSGNATNINSGQNDINIANNQPTFGFVGGGGGGSAFIGTTGPGSFNSISDRNANLIRQSTVNNVTATNFNRQSASTGSVVISGNTVVSGVGGSGDATNFNSGTNSVGISNN